MTGVGGGGWTTDAGGRLPQGVDVTRPSIARVYDYLLGGKDNFPPDRELGDQIKKALPEVHLGVRAQRMVLGRAIRYLVGEAGIRQLVDIGSGLPTAGNVHEVARSIAPETHVVYTDNDPIVLAHARALLAGSSGVAVVDRDLREPERLLEAPELRAEIDFDRPIGLLLCGIVHYISDEEDPAGLIARLVAALPSGSHVFLHHLVQAGTPGEKAAEAAMRQGMGRGFFRTPDQVRAFLDGLELVEPGLVRVPDWRPNGTEDSAEEHPVLRLAVAAVGRKP
ncbi:SAM-dependent methyltransferase [Actinoallomurus sp. NBC_01490]|uniref:SAM-dependent methyltransferase n=1 Tax=Actinoallomurus sp. NBC_01490 TaxID=2903557 RepID=UPI002E3640A2|nr:SAM-dependent methyltransferase [Actinoallomurus sp. NBC_01490]